MMFAAAAMQMASMMASMTVCPEGRETENKHSFQPQAQATAALHLTPEASRPAGSEDALAVASLDRDLPVVVLNLVEGGIEGESGQVALLCVVWGGTVKAGRGSFCGGIKISVYFFIVFHFIAKCPVQTSNESNMRCTSEEFLLEERNGGCPE